MNLLSAISLLAEIGSIELFETSKQRARLFRFGDVHPAIESNDQAGQKATENNSNPSRAFDGQPDEFAFDGLLPEKETRKGFGQSNLRDGAKTFDNNLCNAEERVGLLVFERSFV